jgi:hypothetical protein
LSTVRWCTLGFGPAVLIGLCYLAASPAPGSPSAPRTVAKLPPPPDASPNLAIACDRAAARYRKVLPSEWTFAVYPPYVLGGDLTGEQLETIYRDTVAPTARALGICYFDRVPAEPITILMLSSPESYARCTSALGDGDREEYAGIYVRAERRLVLNIKTGEGTLAHELTHALAHVDFPELPEWIDEGLASLHEECAFSEDGLRLIASPNWRGKLLQQALAADQLPPLAELLTKRFGRTALAPLDYAQARYLCLFLQERQLLGPFYRKCRANIAIDPTGGWSLVAILAHDRIEEVDADFRAWLVGRK